MQEGSPSFQLKYSQAEFQFHANEMSLGETGNDGVDKSPMNESAVALDWQTLHSPTIPLYVDDNLITFSDDAEDKECKDKDIEYDAKMGHDYSIELCMSPSLESSEDALADIKLLL